MRLVSNLHSSLRNHLLRLNVLNVLITMRLICETTIRRRMVSCNETDLEMETLSNESCIRNKNVKAICYLQRRHANKCDVTSLSSGAVANPSFVGSTTRRGDTQLCLIVSGLFCVELRQCERRRPNNGVSVALFSLANSIPVERVSTSNETDTK